MSAGSTTYDVRLSAGHLSAMACAAALMAVWLACTAGGRVWFRERPAVDEQNVLAATERIDPNPASAASLCRLPKIGPALARELVRHRQTGGPQVFRLTDDLLKVPGIGRGIVRTIEPYLAIPNRTK